MAFVWITVARGLMAIALGVALALNGDRAPAALVKFMGLYWILNGTVTLRLGMVAAEGARRRLAIVAGAIGIATGATVLLANVSTTFLLAILGVVIALTGLAHLLGGFEIADVSGRRWRPGVPLGILELGLGATLVLTSEQSGSLSTWLASARALVGGTVLLLDALAMRRRLLAVPLGEAGQRSRISSLLMAMESPPNGSRSVTPCCSTFSPANSDVPLATRRTGSRAGL
jgi:uncharacterized membrane protein HdeD (DUF308 family)